jgi:glycosyltransferase involved in cell wall biosynthesis
MSAKELTAAGKRIIFARTKSTQNMPTISIVMPAYNVERYIAQAIESVQRQTYKDWELVIVDDASTDGTAEVVNRYAQKDARIKLHKNKENSGNCRLPRMEAFRHTIGEWIYYLDGDDYIDDDCLEKMLRSAEKSGKDIVLGRVVRVDDAGRKSKSIPPEDFEMSQTITGKEALSMTIGEWRISFGGELCRRQLWEPFADGDYNYFCSDEIDNRRILLNCSGVAFSDATYYYRMDNSISTTSAANVQKRYFGLLNSGNEIIEMTLEKCADDEELCRKAVDAQLENLKYLTLHYVLHFLKISGSDKKELHGLLKKYYAKLMPHRRLIDVGRAEQLLLLHGYCLFIVAWPIIHEMRKIFNR